MDVASKILVVTVVVGGAVFYLSQRRIERRWRKVDAVVKAVNLRSTSPDASWLVAVSYVLDGKPVESTLSVSNRWKDVNGIAGGPVEGRRLSLYVHPTDSSRCVLRTYSMKMPSWLEVIFGSAGAFFLFKVFDFI